MYSIYLVHWYCSKKYNTSSRSNRGLQRQVIIIIIIIVPGVFFIHINIHFCIQVVYSYWNIYYTIQLSIFVYTDFCPLPTHLFLRLGGSHSPLSSQGEPLTQAATRGTPRPSWTVWGRAWIEWVSQHNSQLFLDLWNSLQLLLPSFSKREREGVEGGGSGVTLTLQTLIKPFSWRIFLFFYF